VFDGPEFGYAYTFAGSIGVVITLPREANLIGESTLDSTSDLVFDMIESKKLEETARRFGPQPIEALNEWVEIHAKNHFGLGLEWRTNNAIRREAENLQSIIYNTETQTTTTVTGELFAVNWEQKTFSFKADDGQIISGQFADAISWEHAASIPARYSAEILRTTKIVVLGKEPKTTITLTRLGTL
jgi:hypothetical protein